MEYKNLYKYIKLITKEFEEHHQKSFLLLLHIRHLLTQRSGCLHDHCIKKTIYRNLQSKNTLSMNIKKHKPIITRAFDFTPGLQISAGKRHFHKRYIFDNKKI